MTTETPICDAIRESDPTIATGAHQGNSVWIAARQLERDLALCDADCIALQAELDKTQADRAALIAALERIGRCNDLSGAAARDALAAVQS